MLADITTSSGIYRIVSDCGRQYIGSARNLHRRARLHWDHLKRGKHHSRFMQRVWNKRGESALRFEVLLHCRPEHLLWYEQRALDVFKPEFNSSPTAGSQLGFRFSTESKLKMAAAARRTRNFTGHQHSEETKARIAAKKRGRKYGPYSAERREKIGAAQKGRTVPAERRERISRTLTGRKQSAETIEKRVLKLRGRKYPPAYGAAIAARLLGRTLPLTHIENIRRSKSKLTEDQVREIRSRLTAGEKQSSIARLYGVDPSVISEINSRKKYDWVV